MMGSQAPLSNAEIAYRNQLLAQHQVRQQQQQLEAGGGHDSKDDLLSIFMVPCCFHVPLSIYSAGTIPKSL